MTRYQDKYHESGISTQVDSIRNTVKRFDEAILAAARAAVPDANGVDRLLAVLGRAAN